MIKRTHHQVYLLISATSLTVFHHKKNINVYFADILLYNAKLILASYS